VRCQIVVTMKSCLYIGMVPKDRHKPGVFEASWRVWTRKADEAAQELLKKYAKREKDVRWVTTEVPS